MIRNLSILLLLAAIVALPFLLRQKDTATAWHAGDPVLVIVTPHNEAIRYEFERGFSRWHQSKYGKPVKIEWRAIGGTTEIMRYLSSEYASAAKAWWTRDLKKRWPDNATETVTAGAPPPATSPELLEVYKTFRETDDPEAFSARIDLFFGGGQFDHSQAADQGLSVAPWKAGEEPAGLFVDASSGVALIPPRLGGETWRTPTLFGNVISTFGICYNTDRLRELKVTRPPAAWEDLADPVYFGQVGAADPSKSGSVAKAFEMMIHQRMHDTVRAAGFSEAQITTNEQQISTYIKAQGPKYHRGELPPSVPPAYQGAVERGWLEGIRLVQRIGANARYFTDSAPKVPIDVSEGDAAVGMSIDFYGRYQAQSTKGANGVERMLYLTPAGGSSVSCDPISLLRGAGGGGDTKEARQERREVAKHFIEFVLSEDGQRLWTYRPGEPGGPEKFALRRLPIRRDFYPSTNPIIQKRHEEHLKHAADDLASPSVDPYTLAEKFTYYPRWTGSHFGFHRELIRVMCVDAGDELKEAWHAIIDAGGPAKQGAAMEKLQSLPQVKLYDRATKAEVDVTLNWRTAPDVLKKYDKLEYTRKWTIAFRDNYRAARDAVKR
ncbi:MAG: iron transporter substrate-binding protein [Phycisphaerales bacterium]|nr:iron transporter substrate-binding protein [Phycisphaerales bacterium]